jgi:hypothetical protein
VTGNIVSRLRPSNQYRADDFKIVSHRETGSGKEEASQQGPASGPSRSETIRMLREFRASLKTLFESIRAREGFFVCELTNESDAPAYVFIQHTKTGLYGGSGLLGFVVRAATAFFRFAYHFRER